MKFFKTLIALTATVALIGFTGCSGDDADDDGDAFTYTSSSGKCQLIAEGDVYMGMTLSIGGDVWPVPEFVDIAVMAITEINAGGGLGNDKKIGAILCDSQCLPSAAHEAMDELLAVKETHGIDLTAIVGPSCSYVAVEIIEKAKNAKIPMIGTSTESAALTTFDDDGYYFRTIASGALLGTAQGAYLANVADLEKLAMVYPNDAWGAGMAFQTGNSFAALVGADACTWTDLDTDGDGENDSQQIDCADVIQLHPYLHEDEDASNDLDGAATVTAIDGFNDANTGVFMMGYDADTDFSGLFSALSGATWSSGNAPYYELSNSLTDQFWTIVGDSTLMVGMGGITSATPDSAAAQHLASALMAATGKAVANYWGNTYDGMYMAAAGMALASDPTSGASVKAALAKTHSGTKVPVGSWADALAAIAADGEFDLDGATGPIDFDENGDVSSLFTHQTFDSSGSYVTDGCWLGDGSVCE